MTGVGFALCITLLVPYQVVDAQTYSVTIQSHPPGTPVDGQPNTLEYPILGSVTLECTVKSSDGSSFRVSSYRWNTEGCYTNPGYNRGHPNCFPHNQKTGNVTGKDLKAEDAGTITCIATIKRRKYESISLTLHISGVTMTGGRESTGYDDVAKFNSLRDYYHIYPKKTGLLFRCVSGLGPTSENNDNLGELYFGSRTIHSGECDGPVMQPRGATIGEYVGIINVFVCGEFNLSDEGVYKCTMNNSNMGGESVRVGVYLHGRMPPVLHTPYRAIRGVFGNSLTLSCTSEGSPPDTFTWIKEGIPIQKNFTTITHTRTIAKFQSNYTISKFSKSDIGNYSCTVTNPIGSDTMHISIFEPPNLPPEISISPKNLTVAESNNVTFTCSANAEPRSVIQWIKAGKVLRNSSNNATIKYIIINKFEGECANTYNQRVWSSCSELSIMNSEPGDSGEYTCNATNDIASNVTYATLMVKGNHESINLIGILSGAAAVPVFILLVILCIIIYCIYKKRDTISDRIKALRSTGYQSLNQDHGNSYMQSQLYRSAST